mgnify:CR=1 FL=1
MRCVVYKSERKPDSYLYVTTKDEFTEVPEALLNMLGELQFIKDLDLASRDKLGYADIAEVTRLLDEQGFFLQMPPGEGYPDL